MKLSKLWYFVTCADDILLSKTIANKTSNHVQKYNKAAQCTPETLQQEQRNGQKCEGWGNVHRHFIFKRKHRVCTHMRTHTNTKEELSECKGVYAEKKYLFRKPDTNTLCVWSPAAAERESRWWRTNLKMLIWLYYLNMHRNILILQVKHNHGCVFFFTMTVGGVTQNRENVTKVENYELKVSFVKIGTGSRESVLPAIRRPASGVCSSLLIPISTFYPEFGEIASSFCSPPPQCTVFLWLRYIVTLQLLFFFPFLKILASFSVVWCTKRLLLYHVLICNKTRRTCECLEPLSWDSKLWP